MGRKQPSAGLQQYGVRVPKTCKHVIFSAKNSEETELQLWVSKGAVGRTNSAGFSFIFSSYIQMLTSLP